MADITVHQYIERKTGAVVTEPLFKNAWIRFLYSTLRENAAWCFHLLTSSHSTAMLGYMNFDLAFAGKPFRAAAFIRDLRINLDECADPGRVMLSARQVFERQIRYWETRPMSESEEDIVSPADSRVLVGSLNQTDALFIKGKYFCFPELLGEDRHPWPLVFDKADFAVFRLTPEQYHYNHAPVCGRVVDIYEVHGRFHSCNPGAVIREVTPLSKNQRVITVIDTDVPGGTWIGNVAMIEITAMMIGRIDQCYSHRFYENPVPVKAGLFLEKGQPKSLFRPGSSTVILLFEKNRIAFCQDIVNNLGRTDATSMFTRGFQTPIVETGVQVRETIARRTVRVTARPQPGSG